MTRGRHTLFFSPLARFIHAVFHPAFHVVLHALFDVKSVKKNVKNRVKNHVKKSVKKACTGREKERVWGGVRLLPL
jgi:predicted transcriptional regulator YheO